MSHKPGVVLTSTVIVIAKIMLLQRLLRYHKINVNSYCWKVVRVYLRTMSGSDPDIQKRQLKIENKAMNRMKARRHHATTLLV